MTTQASTETEALKARKKGRKRLMPVKRKRAIRLSAEDAKVEEEKPNEVILFWPTISHLHTNQDATREVFYVLQLERDILTVSVVDNKDGTGPLSRGDIRERFSLDLGIGEIQSEATRAEMLKKLAGERSRNYYRTITVVSTRVLGKCQGDSWGETKDQRNRRRRIESRACRNFLRSSFPPPFVDRCLEMSSRRRSLSPAGRWRLPLSFFSRRAVIYLD